MVDWDIEFLIRNLKLSSLLILAHLNFLNYRADKLNFQRYQINCMSTTILYNNSILLPRIWICLPFLTRCFTRLGIKVKQTKLFYYKLSSFLITDPGGFLHMIQMLLPILPLLSYVGKLTHYIKLRQIRVLTQRLSSRRFSNL